LTTDSEKEGASTATSEEEGVQSKAKIPLKNLKVQEWRRACREGVAFPVVKEAEHPIKGKVWN
jgi:hypothetical protein